MPSKEFLEYADRIPKEPPLGMQDAGDPIPEEFADLPLPILPPHFRAPVPELSPGFTGGEIELCGVRGLYADAEDTIKGAAFLHIHGGGFTIGSAMEAVGLLEHFVKETHLASYSADYRLAPYARYPEPLEDCLQFYKGLLEKGYTGIVLGGESAGASLVLSLAHAIRKAGLPEPIALWCSSPVAEIDFADREISYTDMFSETCKELCRVYCPGADLHEPLLSPYYGDFTDFPPLFLQAGSTESLSYGIIRVLDKAAKAGNEVHFHMGKDMPHTFAMDFGKYPEATEAMREIVSFVNYQVKMHGFAP